MHTHRAGYRLLPETPPGCPGEAQHPAYASGPAAENRGVATAAAPRRPGLTDLPPAALARLLAPLPATDIRAARLAHPALQGATRHPEFWLRRLAHLDSPGAFHLLPHDPRLDGPVTRPWLASVEIAVIASVVGLVVVGIGGTKLATSVPAVAWYINHTAVGAIGLAAWLLAASAGTAALAGHIVVSQSVARQRQQARAQANLRLSAHRAAAAAPLAALRAQGTTPRAGDGPGLRAIATFAASLEHGGQAAVFERAAQREDMAAMLRVAAEPGFAAPLAQHATPAQIGRALTRALDGRDWDAVAGLCRGGARVDASAHDGPSRSAERALTVAVREPRWPTVELLLQRGAAPSASLWVDAARAAWRRAQRGRAGATSSDACGPLTQTRLAGALSACIGRRDRGELAAFAALVREAAPSLRGAALRPALADAVLTGDLPWATALHDAGARLASPEAGDPASSAANERLGVALARADAARAPATTLRLLRLADPS